MGFSGRATRAIVALIAVATPASASSTFQMDDGFAGMDGSLSVKVDDFGSYGRQYPANAFDWFQPPGIGPDHPTYLAGAFLFITTGTDTSSVLLADESQWENLVEGGANPDGIIAATAHSPITRTITTGIGGSPTQVTSAFEITAAGGIKLRFDLVQTITTSIPTATSVLDQRYTITNTGTVNVDLVFVGVWEPDIYYVTSPSFTDDVVGTDANRCAIYVHNPGSTTQSIAFADGPATTLTSHTYFAGKGGEKANGLDPAFASYGDTPLSYQWVWNGHGIPAPWRNWVVGPGYTGGGDSGTISGDASLGMEWRFSLAMNAAETIDLERHYGTIAVPCATLATCGNNAVDPGEACDGADTATCNGKTCMSSSCGDGYPNAMAGEACDTLGVDSDTCNGLACSLPACLDGYKNEAAGEACDDGEETASCTAMCQVSSCGDGYVNAAAGEECESGSLCDMTTCTVTFSVGGGCAGCGAQGGGTSTLWLALPVVAFTVRRRRRARRA